MKRYRAIVLSVVKHGYIAHAVVAHPQFDLVAVTDDSNCPAWVHERNQKFAEHYHIPYSQDPSSAFEEHDADVAVISSEAERHCDLAVRAAEAGLHIIVDKPMSTTVAECDRLVAAVRENKVQCLVWNRSFLPALLQAREAVERGDLGELKAIHCDFYFSKDAGPPKGSHGEGEPRIDWLERQIEAHADGSDGGVGVTPIGELQVEGIYPLAYIRMLTGNARVERVFARTTAHFHQAHVDNAVDDLATVTLEMADDVVGSVCIGRIGAAAHPDIGEIKLHLIGTEGSLVISEARPEVAVYYRDQPEKEFRNNRVAEENNFLLLEDFVRAIETGVPPMLDAQGGRDICAIVVAAVESGRTGNLVEVTY
ncbi:MAG: myo-inositol 2-dehydrogenase/D-chiro-inositol 1-dehydrogenase [Verrucomicrobiales bacterium]